VRHDPVDHQPALQEGKVVMYTDGSCLTNPGPGGFGVVFLPGKRRRELSGGFRLTTNNRMELTACLQGLRALKRSRRVVLYCDSRYVVAGIKDRWAGRWRERGWRKSDGKPVENADLWAQLLDLCEFHEVEFVWLRGHAGTRENERCDWLSLQAAGRKNLPEDTGYSPAAPPKTRGSQDRVL
jgi:ribonuclease HI